MMFYEVIPIRLFRSGATVLTYSSNLKLQPGHIVEIPIGKTNTIGIVSKKTDAVSFKTKQIISLLYKTPIPKHIVQSLFWLSDYYLSPIQQFASLALPTGIKKKRRSNVDQDEPLLKLPIINLNPAQKKALEAISSSNEHTKLLHGITGSGKTNIYLKLAAECLKAQKSVILLVPEIALTSQLVQIFHNTFGRKITLIHSKQTEAKRHQIWEKLLNSDEPEIIIGPRSALFAPIKNLGLIIIDEAHEASYFQENSPRYSSIRLASFIAKKLNITCLLGTATPLITDYYLASAKDSVISLSEKAKQTAIKPDIKIVDLKDRSHFTKNRYFSNELLEEIEKNLDEKHQTLIFHNRRGSALLTICEKCGWQALCPTCFLPLTLHSDSYSLICHSCGYCTKIPTCCPECHHTDIIHKGFGTKLLEAELKKNFPKAKIARFDADNNKNDSLDAQYEQVKSGDINIIIGTQTIARGLDLPLLASVGVVQADSGLSLPDFSSEERTFHLLTQVIGRIGRGHLDKASAIIQTFQPENPLIYAATESDYSTFYKYAVQKRRRQHFPPFTYLAKITITYKTERTSISKIKMLHSFLKINADPSITYSRPTPAFREHTQTGFSWQIILKSSSREKLVALLKQIDPKYNARITLDPPSLL